MKHITPSPFAATFRDDDGRVVGTTDGSTICWYPPDPSSRSITSEDGRYERTLRCGWCQGCREFERRRVDERLVKHFEKHEGEIWRVNIPAPLIEQSAIAERVKHSGVFDFEPATYRVSTGEIALLVLGPKPKLARSRMLKRSGASVTRIYRSRGRRAFEPITRGMRISRDEWGEQTKRFYHRGLPPAEREKWIVDTRRGLRTKHPHLKVGVRAYSEDGALHAPDAWRPARLVHRKGPIEKRVSRTPVPLGTVLSNLMPQFAGHGAPRITPLSPARKARRSSMSGIPDARELQRAGVAARPSVASEAPPHPPSYPDQSKALRGGHLSSPQSPARPPPFDPDQWVAKMRLIKPRGDPEPSK